MRWRCSSRRIAGATARGIYNYQAEAEKILRGMRHHPLLTGTPPFRIHPGDPPFIPPDKPWPSPNNRREAAEAAAQGKPWPPAFRFNRSPASRDRRPDGR